MQVYRADVSFPNPDGSILWCAKTIFGTHLAKIENCRLDSLEGNMRRTVYITGEANTYFSVPAVCMIQGCRVKGYVTHDSDDVLVFRHTYY